MSDWAQPGVKVLDGPNVRTIAKVYKNGNFVIEGSLQQFRPGSDGIALATNGGYGRAKVYMATPERLEMAAQERRVAHATSAIYAAVDSYKAVCRSKDGGRIIALAKALSSVSVD